MFNAKLRIPVLLYHQIGYEKDWLMVSPEQFEAHLKILKKMGFVPIFMGEAVDLLENKKQQNKKVVVITFDDGHLSDWAYAFPILKKYSMKATFFISTSWVLDGKKRQNLEDVWKKRVARQDWERLLKSEKESGNRFVSWQELLEMEESGFADIQAHGHRHIYIEGERIFEKGNLLNVSAQERIKIITEELLNSKSLIEQKLKKICRHYAWPGGGYSKDSLETAKKIGFYSSSSIELGSNDSQTDRFILRRIVVKRWFASRIRFIFFFWLLSNNFLKMLKRKALGVGGVRA